MSPKPPRSRLLSALHLVAIALGPTVPAGAVDVTVEILDPGDAPLPPGDAAYPETVPRVTVELLDGTRVLDLAPTPATFLGAGSAGTALFHPRWGGGDPVRYGYGSWITLAWEEDHRVTFNLEDGSTDSEETPGATSVRFAFEPITVTVDQLDLARAPLPPPSGNVVYSSFVRADGLFDSTAPPFSFSGANRGHAKLRPHWGGGGLLHHGWGDAGWTVDWEGGVRTTVRVPQPPPDPDAVTLEPFGDADSARLEFLFQPGELTLATVDRHRGPVPGVIDASGPLSFVTPEPSPVTVVACANGVSNFRAQLAGGDSGLVALDWRSGRTTTRILEPPETWLEPSPGQRAIHFAAEPPCPASPESACERLREGIRAACPCDSDWRSRGELLACIQRALADAVRELADCGAGPDLGDVLSCARSPCP